MKIGQEFTDPATQQRWRVTDVGTRTFQAVCLSDAHVEADPSWLEGPPYAVAEEVWDEYSFGALAHVAGIRGTDPAAAELASFWQPRSRHALLPA